MPPKLSFGIMTLQNLPYASLVERWRQLDALGWDSVWLGDHFVDPFSPDEPWYDGWTLLAALATHTKRIRIGTLVSSITLRNPALLAKEAMTVDHVSQGRLELGIGAAGRPLDHTMTGSDVWGSPERVQRFRESVEIVDRLLRQRVTTYAGRWYRTEEAVMNPGPLQQPRPPLTLAAHGPTTIRIAARYADSWNSLGKLGASADESLRATRERNQQLDEYCAALGRDPHEIERSLLCGFTPDRPFVSLDAFHEFVGRYRDVGIEEFIFYWLGDEGHPVFADRGRKGVTITDRATLERIAMDAIPALRSGS